MKTITKIILLITLLSVSNIFGQYYYNATDYFATQGYPEILDTSNYSASTIFDFHNSESKIFNVHFYGLETTYGDYPSSLDENYSLEVIAKLNIAFNPYNIFFKYRGYDYYSEVYNGSELIDQNHPHIMERMYQVAQNEGTDNNINIVLHHTTCNNDRGSVDIYKKIISLRYCTSSPIHVVYQMGHLFGLFKTQQGTGSGTNYYFQNPNPCDIISNFTDRLFFPNHNANVSGTPENVTRDTTNPNYNADTAGDMVTDTPAAFAGSEHNYCHRYDSNYDYISHPSITDNSSEHLMYENLDMLNFMCLRYSLLPAFNRSHFTNGQGVRMRETIAIPSLNFSDVETDIASLYEPYKNDYFHTGYSNSNFRPLFQPGFDYKFVECGMPSHSNHGNVEIYNEPTSYDNVNFSFNLQSILHQVNPYSLDFNNITHPNHSAIIIEQIDGVQPRKCYNNYNRSANSGSVIKFVDGMPNTNVIIEQKNNSEINDPSLIRNLENGLYIIQKNYDDGTQKQQTILKNENN